MRLPLILFTSVVLLLSCNARNPQTARMIHPTPSPPIAAQSTEQDVPFEDAFFEEPFAGDSWLNASEYSREEVIKKLGQPLHVVSRSLADVNVQNGGAVIETWQYVGLEISWLIEAGQKEITGQRVFTKNIAPFKYGISIGMEKSKLEALFPAALLEYTPDRISYSAEDGAATLTFSFVDGRVSSIILVRNIQ